MSDSNLNSTARAIAEKALRGDYGELTGDEFVPVKFGAGPSGNNMMLYGVGGAVVLVGVAALGYYMWNKNKQ
jgi:hypothetical protein